MARLRRFAHWLDAGIGLPGTSVRFGVDPILGLVPGLGDAVGALLSAGILLEAARRGASRATLVRMASNVALDALLGAIPVLGDAFDLFWKANLENVALLERHATHPARAGQADRTFVALLGGAVLVLCGGLVVAGALLTAWLVRTLAGM